jgi:VWFA-related protein
VHNPEAKKMKCRVNTPTAVCFCMFALVLCHPSQIAAQSEPVTTPLFRASTHLTMLDVVVTDKNGNPVPGLRLEDFNLKEDGKGQTITGLAPPSATRAQAAPPALSPNVYSNAPAYRLSGTTPTVIVLDAANTSSPDQFYARREMLAYVKQQYKPGQRMAVLTLTDRLNVVQDFTGDPNLLLASLEKVQPSSPTVSQLANEPSIGGMQVTNPQGYVNLVSVLNTFQQAQTQYVADRRAEITLEALRRIVSMLGGLPGRKNVIWLTAGFPFALNPVYEGLPEDWRDLPTHSLGVRPKPGNATSLTPDQQLLYSGRIREISARLASTQVAIYPVDVRGLSTGRTSNIIDQQQTMQEIARETGGRAFFNRNDLDNSVVLAERDRAATYTLAYYPANKKWDGKYRSISVKIARQGVESAYRRGYFAVDAMRTSEARRDEALAESFQDGAPDTLVTFQARVLPNGPGTARVEFLVDANALSVEDDAVGKKFDAGFYVAGCSSDGRVLKVEQADFNKSLSLDVYQKMVREGMRLHLDVPIAPGSDNLRLAVRDNRTGYVGTLTAAIPTN